MHLTHACKIVLETLPTAISLASLATARQANKRARKLEDQQDSRHLEQLRRVTVEITYRGAPAIRVTNNSSLDLADITLEQADVGGDNVEGYTFIPNPNVPGLEPTLPMRWSVLRSEDHHEFPLILCDPEGNRDNSTMLYGHVGVRATVSFRDDLGTMWRKIGSAPPTQVRKHSIAQRLHLPFGGNRTQ